MSVQYAYTVDDGLLVVEANGVISSDDDMILHGKRVVAEADSRDCSKILVADSSLSIQLTVYEAVRFAEIMDQISLALQGYRIAAIANSGNAESRALVETALVNRAVMYKVFRSKNEALAWLRGIS